MENPSLSAPLNARIAETLSVLEKASALSNGALGNGALGNVTLASSMSAEDVVLIDLIARHKLNIGIFAIDTLMLHADTRAQIERVSSHYGLLIDVYTPNDGLVAEYIAQNGKHAFYETLELRLSCCHIRKVEPLERALAGKSGWVTGQRRAQAQSRAELATEEVDTVRNVAKFNPLASWTWDDILAYVEAFNVPISPLYKKGYVTIGCDSCTRAVRPGEDPRAARWWWEDASDKANAKECGLHVMEKA